MYYELRLKGKRKDDAFPYPVDTTLDTLGRVWGLQWARGLAHSMTQTIAQERPGEWVVAVDDDGVEIL